LRLSEDNVNRKLFNELLESKGQWGASVILHDRIEPNPKIMLGKPVIRGTRITVELMVRKMAEGCDEKPLLAAYPKLTREDVQAALRYAADTVAHEETR
jgi:uncharacterized protein (DUF433 family)